MTAADDNAHASASFATTQWTRILAATGNSTESRQLLRELCEAWYAPVHAFVRQTCYVRDDVRDLTHEFFAKLLEGRSLEHLERGRGKFRSYLLGAVKHFLADVRDREGAVRRGGGMRTRSLNEPAVQLGEESDSTAGEQALDPQGFPNDAFFDREWALALLERSLQRLELEVASEGRGDSFRRLKHWLTGDVPSLPQSEVARGLGLTETALKVAIHRLRKRFREVVRAEIASTVTSCDDIDGELSYLVAALGHARRSSTDPGERPSKGARPV